MADKNMTVREYAESRDFEVVGKLTYLGVDRGSKVWVDEAGNEYSKSKRGFCIIDTEGAVY